MIMALILERDLDQDATNESPIVTSGTSRILNQVKDLPNFSKWNLLITGIKLD